MALITANERENPDRWEPIKVFGFQSGGGGSRGVASRSADILPFISFRHSGIQASRDVASRAADIFILHFIHSGTSAGSRYLDCVRCYIDCV